MGERERGEGAEQDAPTITAAWSVGLKVRDARKRLGLSQSEVAELMTLAGCPWSQGTVWSLETGKRDVTVGELFALGLVLHLRPAQLMSSALIRLRLGRGAQWVPGHLFDMWAFGLEDPLEYLDYKSAAYGSTVDRVSFGEATQRARGVAPSVTVEGES